MSEISSDEFEAVYRDFGMSMFASPQDRIDALIEEIARLRKLVEPQNIRERWNVDRDGDDLLVCFNEHDKGEKCEYVRYVPASPSASVELPELPRAVAHVHSNGDVCMDRPVESNGVWPVDLVTLKQAHDYARSYASASVPATSLDHPTEAKGKTVPGGDSEPQPATPGSNGFAPLPSNPYPQCMTHGECFGGECIYGSDSGGAIHAPLLEALRAAATSLETISMIAGRVSYGDPPIPTYMESFTQVRSFAANRAQVARDVLAAAIAAAEGQA